MSHARARVKRLMKKHISTSRKEKIRKVAKLGPYGIVIEFIKAVENISSDSIDHVEFEASLLKDAELMYDRFKTIDPEVDVTVLWNNEYDIDNWNQLQVEGVKIKWGKFWRQKHPLEPDTKYIDIAQLMLEGYLD